MNEPLELQLARQIVDEESGTPKASRAYAAAKAIIDAADANRICVTEKAKQERAEEQQRNDLVAERWPSVAEKGYKLDARGGFAVGRYPRISISGNDVDTEGYDEYLSFPIDVVLAVLDMNDANHTANELRARVTELEELLADKTEKAPPAI